MSDTIMDTVAAGGTLTNRQRDYITRVRELDMIEGWWWGNKEFRPRPDQPENPGGPAVPYIWSWDKVGPLVRESSDVIGLGQGPGEAERRVLVLRNPGLNPKYAMTNSFFGDLQFIEPGEIAPSHRHTTTAARFVFEGQGGWTTVEGEKITLVPGDVVLNPQWAWHAHGNAGPDHFLFFDVLDIPLITALGTAVWDFGYEKITGDKNIRVQALDRPDNYSFEMFHHGGIVPKFVNLTRADHSPLVAYRYKTVVDALNRLRNDKGSAYDGVIVELRNPASGLSVAPTMCLSAQLLRPGEKTLSHRHNTSTIYIVMDGKGVTTVGDKRLKWSKFDIFSIPSWAWHEHENMNKNSDAVLYSVSDSPVIEKMGLYREQRKTVNGELQDTEWVPNRYTYT